MIAYAIKGSQRGQITIDSLKLNDRALPEARLEKLQPLRGLNQILLLAMQRPNDQEFQKLAKDAKEILENAILDSAEFAAVVRCAIDSKF